MYYIIIINNKTINTLKNHVYFYLNEEIQTHMSSSGFKQIDYTVSTYKSLFLQ